MSLLMDALKKAELAKRQGQSEDAGGSTAADIQIGLELEPVADSVLSVPAPATAKHSATIHNPVSGPIRDNRNKPPASTPIPSMPGRREPNRSENIPLIGAVIAIITGWAVSNIPASAGFNPRPWIR